MVPAGLLSRETSFLGLQMLTSCCVLMWSFLCAQAFLVTSYKDTRPIGLGPHLCGLTNIASLKALNTNTITSRGRVSICGLQVDIIQSITVGHLRSPQANQEPSPLFTSTGLCCWLVLRPATLRTSAGLLRRVGLYVKKGAKQQQNPHEQHKKCGVFCDGDHTRQSCLLTCITTEMTRSNRVNKRKAF